MLDGEQPQKNCTVSYNGMCVREIYHFKVSWDNIDLSELIAEQAEFNLDYIRPGQGISCD